MKIDLSKEALSERAWTYRKVLRWSALAVGCLIGLFFCDWSGTTGWFLFPIIGLVGGIVGTSFAIYGAYVQRAAHRLVYGNEDPSYRVALKKMRKERESLAAYIYGHKGYPSLYRAEYAALKKLDIAIDEHMGLSEPVEDKPVKSKW